MRRVIAAALALGLLAARPARAGDLERWRAPIAEASTRFGLPRSWIERVIRIESGGWTMRRGVPIVSPKGAMGLMQLMPATWRALTREHGLGADPHDPRANILAGAAYLRQMYDRFGYPGLFAAYNAGPARYAAFLAGRGALPAETRAYLARAASPSASKAAGSEPAGRAVASPDPVFALRREVPPDSADLAQRREPPSVFFARAAPR